MRVLGIDPGLTTGYVVRDGKTVYERGLLEFEHRPFPAGPELYAAMGFLNEVMVQRPRVTVVAVEGLVVPNPHMGMTNPAGLMATAVVLGAVLQAWPDAIVVPPSGNGANPYQAYPSELIGAREGPALSGKLRHCRSAWDVAGKAKFYARAAS